MPKGGKRKGAGRPQGSSTKPPTVPVRVREGTAATVKACALGWGVRQTEAAERLVDAGARALRVRTPDEKAGGGHVNDTCRPILDAFAEETEKTLDEPANLPAGVGPRR